MEKEIYSVLEEMADYLSAAQMKILQEVLLKKFTDNPQKCEKELNNNEYLDMFISAKDIEGCSKRTLIYYRSTIKNMLEQLNVPVQKITTEMLRKYIGDYQNVNHCSKTTIDNVRRNLSSFFSWLENEDYIIKSPIRRIHKIRTGTTVKETFTDENIELMRDSCNKTRDLAMIDILYSTGMRVGELVNLNIDDIDFNERQCIVHGKGNKERQVYFDARTKLHLTKYLSCRFR